MLRAAGGVRRAVRAIPLSARRPDVVAGALFISVPMISTLLPEWRYEWSRPGNPKCWLPDQRNTYGCASGFTRNQKGRRSHPDFSRKSGSSRRILKRSSMPRMTVAVLTAGLAWLAPATRGLLRLLRRQGRHQDLQQGVEGRHRPRRRSHRHDDVERLQGRAEGVRGRGAGADLPQKEQIHVGDKALVDHLDAFTAPRLVEYFDENPCDRRRYDDERRAADGRAGPPAPAARAGFAPSSLGVTIEAHLHGRRVRHPDPLGEGERRARDLAARERLQDSAGRGGGARQLHRSRTCASSSRR